MKVIHLPTVIDPEDVAYSRRHWHRVRVNPQRHAFDVNRKTDFGRNERDGA